MSNELLAQATIRHLLRHEQESLYPGSPQALKEVKDLAQNAQKTFGEAKNHTSLQKLEGLALRTDLVTDILDFVKRQSGKSGSKKLWGDTGFGPALVRFIEGPLRNRATELGKGTAFQAMKPNPYLPDELMLLIWLELTRSVISHLAAHARFAAA